MGTEEDKEDDLNEYFGSIDSQFIGVSEEDADEYFEGELIGDSTIN